MLPLGILAAFGIGVGELLFELNENLSETESSCEPYAHNLLLAPRLATASSTISSSRLSSRPRGHTKARRG
ncbi:hypothetical protein ABZP36_025885 [Zizania latifolia]